MSNMDVAPMANSERERIEAFGAIGLEIRTHLAAIKGSATTVLSSPTPLPPDQISHFFQIIDEQADRIYSLISSVLAAVEAGAESPPIAPQLTDLKALISEARATFLEGGAGNTVSVDLPRALPMIAVDRQLVAHVLNSLLSGASRYSPAESTIRVSGFMEGAQVAISVAYESRDTTHDNSPLQFDDSRRTLAPELRHNSWQTDPELAVCQKIVEAYGGRILAENLGPGQGSRFIFTVPVAQGTASGSAPDPDTQDALSRRPDREQTYILAVGSDQRTLRYIDDVLSEAGYVAVETCSPDEIERVMDAGKPQLVLLELTHRAAGEPSTMERIAGVGPTPVILVSGDQFTEEALGAGAADCIFVPFSPDELAARVGAVLRKRVEIDAEESRQPYIFGDLTINYQERRVYLSGHPVQVTATEYKLLSELSINAGRVLTHEYLLRQVWVRNVSPDLRLLRAFVKSLRRKLRDDYKSPTYIFTESRVGYRMAERQ